VGGLNLRGRIKRFAQEEVKEGGLKGNKRGGSKEKSTEIVVPGRKKALRKQRV